MSLVDWLMDQYDKPALAKELAATAKENAALRDRIGVLETEIFWMKVAERDERNP